MRSRTTGPASGGVRSPLPIADAAPVGLLGLDSTGSCGYANAEWGRLAGREPVHALGFGWLDAVDPRDRTAVERTVAEAMAAPAGTSRSVRFRLARPDGAVTPARAILRALPGDGDSGADAGGGHHTATPDHPARRIVASIAPDADTMPPSVLEALVESVPCGVFVQSGLGRVDLVNAQAKQMLSGTPRPGGWVGADADEMTAALAARMADPEAFREGERTMRDTGETSGFRLHATDGGHFEGMFVPLDDHGYPGHACLLWDVTGREEARRRREKRMRAELAAHRLGVHAQRQRAREAELAEQQLQQRNEALAAVDALRKQLLATASHELRSPLASITSFCELLTDSVDPGGEGEEFIRIIEHNATKLLHLVDDLLTLAMLGAPGNEPHKARTDLASLVDEAAEHASGQARRSEIALASHVDGSAWAQVDAVRIGQVLDNLVGNAVKYSRAGDRVDVWLEPEGEPGFHRVQVADTGIGIPSEELSKVFDEFYRASTARTSGVPGTGLGLVIAQTIARKHGGSITLSSGTGQGTTAVLRLPATA